MPEHQRLPLIFTLSVGVSLLLLGLVWHWRQREFTNLLPLALILSGAWGNILDRANNGYVVDFLYIHYQYEYNFPIFNVADMLVFGGFCLLFYQNWNDSPSIDSPQPD